MTNPNNSVYCNSSMNKGIRIMNDIINDINVIENALIAINEGASDEKYAALYSLEKLLLEKKDILTDFEKNCPENLTT